MCTQVSDANLAQMPEFRQRVNVLRALQYVSTDNTVEVKARTHIQAHKPAWDWFGSACSVGRCDVL